MGLALPELQLVCRQLARIGLTAGHRGTALLDGAQRGNATYAVYVAILDNVRPAHAVATVGDIVTVDNTAQDGRPTYAAARAGPLGTPTRLVESPAIEGESLKDRCNNSVVSGLPAPLEQILPRLVLVTVSERGGPRQMASVASRI
jgi:hypothetical protein